VTLVTIVAHDVDAGDWGTVELVTLILVTLWHYRHCCHRWYLWHFFWRWPLRWCHWYGSTFGTLTTGGTCEICETRDTVDLLLIRSWKWNKVSQSVKHWIDVGTQG
jgi:hypothetical protein